MSPGQKLLQQIATPLKSIGSKIVTPMHKSKESQNLSPGELKVSSNAGSVHGKTALYNFNYQQKII